MGAVRFLRRLWDWVGHVSTIVFVWSLAGSAVTTFLAWVFSDLSPGQLVLLGIAVFLLVVASLGTWVHPIWERSHLDEKPIPRAGLADLPSQPTKPSPPVEPRPAVADRRFTTATPKRLVGFYRDHLSIQAESLVEPFLGKWIKVSGPLGNVAPFPPGAGSAVSVSFAHRLDGVLILMWFTDEELVGQLATMERGEEIAVIGRIEKVDKDLVVLDDCELV